MDYSYLVDRIQLEYGIKFGRDTKRDAGGSVILHWKPSEIEQVLIPIVDFEIQKQISQKVAESFHLKKQSEQLLEMAKTAVEMAIEESEMEALGWMESKTKGLTLP